MRHRTGFVSNSSSSSFLIALDHGADRWPVVPAADWGLAGCLVDELGFRFVNCGAREFVFDPGSCEPKEDVFTADGLRSRDGFDGSRGISLHAFVCMEEGERSALMGMGVPFVEWHEHGTWLIAYDGKSGKYLKIHNLPAVWGLYHGFGSMTERQFISHGAENAIRLVDIGKADE